MVVHYVAEGQRQIVQSPIQLEPITMLLNLMFLFVDYFVVICSIVFPVFVLSGFA
jgi:hypothetical protein